MNRILILIVLVASSQAQNIRMDAGTSTMGLAGSGGSVTAYFPTNTVALSGGVVDGHAVAGASDSFALRGGQVTIGSQSLSQSIDGGGITMQGVGVSFTRKDADNVSGVFAGSVGTGFSLPWMSAPIPQHIGVSAFMQRKIDHLTLGVVSAVAGGERTALGSASWRSSSLSASATAGMLNNQVFSSGVVMYQRQNISVTGSHFDTFTPLRARSDSIGGGFYTQMFSVGGNISESATARGSLLAENVMASVRSQRFTNTVGVFHSRTLLLTDTLDERLNRHWMLSQLVSRSQGSTSLSFGGNYTSNRFSCGVAQGVSFVPSIGYVRTTSVTVSLSIHGTRMTATAVEAPSIRPQYSVGAEKWAQGPMEPKTRVHRAAHGKFSVVGVVQDANGEPLAGVAVVVGQDVLFSNRSGKFEAHAKNSRPVEVRVDLDQSVVAGEWATQSCPTEVTPAVEPQAVTIILVKP